MTIYEILKFNKEMLLRLRQAGIRLDDCQYIDLYTDYQDLRFRGGKITYIVTVLAERYSISVRKVYSLIRLFESDCTNGAA
ncbi:MAG: hypothetical protein IJ190_10495 [Prevotella sp.]|nr:hypothetical protein [Prevotella sp.]